MVRIHSPRPKLLESSQHQDPASTQATFLPILGKEDLLVRHQAVAYDEVSILCNLTRPFKLGCKVCPFLDFLVHRFTKTCDGGQVRDRASFWWPQLIQFSEPKFVTRLVSGRPNDLSGSRDIEVDLVRAERPQRGDHSFPATIAGCGP